MPGEAPKKKSTLEYFTHISHPITENAVVQDLLNHSEAATSEVGQKYTLNTFDLGVVMKACPIIWKYAERYQKHIVTPGPFHTAMNYIGMITAHKCRGSSYAELVLEAGLVTSSSLNSVLSGKSFARALNFLKAMCEALEILLLERFIEEEDVQMKPEALTNLIKSCDRHILVTQSLGRGARVGVDRRGDP